MSSRPTRADHLEECRLISLALLEYVREMHEVAKFHVDIWEPKPWAPPTQQH